MNTIPFNLTYIFDGDSKSRQEIFSRFKQFILSQKITKHGTIREDYHVYANDDTCICASIGVITLDIRKVGIGSIVISQYDRIHENGLEKQHGNVTVKKVNDIAEGLAERLGYTAVSQCTRGVPYTCTFVKPYEGITIY